MSKGHFTHNVVEYHPGTSLPIFISDNLRRNALMRAYVVIFEFLQKMGLTPHDTTASFTSEHVALLEGDFNTAYGLGLLGHGGVTEKNFLGLWLINFILAPAHYLESGINKGSSIIAALGNRRLKELTGYDPVLTNLAVTDFPGTVKVSMMEKDFSEDTCNNEHGDNALIYFDDHINTARRILESHARGFKRLIFDDSCGIAGTTQRRWPSMPSLFFIVNHDMLSKGDSMTWSHSITWPPGAPADLNGLRFTFTEEVIALCREAASKILSWGKIPDLSDFVLPQKVFKESDTTQHYVVLT